jgi:hypothetical protein
LLGTYLAFTAASTAEAGLFGVLIALIAYGDIRVATRSLLGLEGISVILIVVL